MKQILIIFAGGAIAVSAIALGFTYLQTYQERTSLEGDLQYRTHLLIDSLIESVQPAYNANASSSVQRLVDRFTDRERLGGLLVVDSNGTTIAVSKGLPSNILVRNVALKAMDTDAPQGALANGYYIFASPIHREVENLPVVSGAFVAVQNAAYIDASIADIWSNNFLRLLLQLVLFFVLVFALMQLLILRPLRNLEASIQSVRMGRPVSPSNQAFFFKPLAQEISSLVMSLGKARMSASEEARMRLEQIDSPWTAERLKQFATIYLKKRPIFVVSNREPYVHYKERGKIRYSTPAHGMVTAVESVMESCGGTWIAHGSGDADREVVDDEQKVAVPPDEPRYTLKRVWLTRSEVEGHYSGFSNEALFPLCHIVYMRPTFKKTDWLSYKKVNGKFAASLLEEIRDVERPVVLVQDLHFAVVPAIVKKSRPDADIALFWHHPWPSAEQFSVCPWRKEILEGMLGADVVGFHTQQYCNNFLETVGKEVEALIDYEQFSITHNGHTTYVKPFPISVAFTGGGESVTSEEAVDRSILDRLGIHTEYLALGVERMDYIKGLLEKFRGLEEFLDTHASYRGKLTLLQIAAPSRESVEKFRTYRDQVVEEAKRINQKFAEGNWRPIVLENVQYGRAELHTLYKLADVCLVTSLHDGMNLVSKEFVAARDDEAGSLILSKFTGSARTLKDALIVNPYSAVEVAEAIAKALSMSRTEQYRRMRGMRNTVKNFNVYRWAAEFLKAIADIT